MGSGWIQLVRGISGMDCYMKKIIALLAAIVLLGCDGQNASPKQEGSDKTASVGFTISIQRSDEDEVSPDGTFTRSTDDDEPIDCDRHGIANIHFLVYDDKDQYLDEADFECSAGGGVLPGIKAGDDRKFVVLGLDADGITVFRGKETRTLEAGKKVNVPIRLSMVQLPVANEMYGNQMTVSYDNPIDADEIIGTKLNCDNCPQVWLDANDNACRTIEATNKISCTFNELTGLTEYCYTLANEYKHGSEPYIAQGAEACFSTINRIPPDKERDYIKLDYNEETKERYETDPASQDWTMVYDKNTGLTWKTKSKPGEGHNAEDTYTKWEAGNYEDTLNDAKYGNYDDWRLPTRGEMLTLFLLREEVSVAWPAIDKNFFTHLHSRASEQLDPLLQWLTSTVLRRTGESHFVGTIYSGELFSSSLDDETQPDNLKRFHVVAVRGPHQTTDLEPYEDTVLDKATGLMWQKIPREQKSNRGFDEAIKYCEDLQLGGHSDWRLPTIMELNTIIDDSRSDPALDTNSFINHSGEQQVHSLFISSTQTRENRIFLADFDTGTIVSRVIDPTQNPDAAETWRLGVRAVRVHITQPGE